jgi:hypothetical protein
LSRHLETGSGRLVTIETGSGRQGTSGESPEPSLG